MRSSKDGVVTTWASDRGVPDLVIRFNASDHLVIPSAFAGAFWIGAVARVTTDIDGPARMIRISFLNLSAARVLHPYEELVES
jgi:hypothetical protein